MEAEKHLVFKIIDDSNCLVSNILFIDTIACYFDVKDMKLLKEVMKNT